MSAVTAARDQRPRYHLASRIWQRRRPLRLGVAGAVGIAGLAFIVGFALIGPLFVAEPHSDTAAILQAPSSAHWLGTDYAGRDNFALLVYGAKDMLLLAALAGVLTTAIAVLVGMVGAYTGRWVDWILVRFTDLWLTIPRFILLLVIASMINIGSTAALAALIAAFSWPFLARQLRAQTLSVRRREYVEAARLLDLGTFHVLARYLVPAVAPFIVISTVQAMTQAIYQQVGLAFFGIVPLTDNWGVLISIGYQQNAIYLPDAAWSLLGPVAAICFLQLSLVLTSRALEERFDPRLAGSE